MLQAAEQVKGSVRLAFRGVLTIQGKRVAEQWYQGRARPRLEDLVYSVLVQGLAGIPDQGPLCAAIPPLAAAIQPANLLLKAYELLLDLL